LTRRRSRCWLLLACLAGAAATGCAGGPTVVTKIVDGRVITTRPVSPQAYEHVARALLLEQEGRWEEAARELQRALPFDDEAPELHAHLAEVFLRLARIDDAADQVARSLALEPTVAGLIAEGGLREARGDAKGAVDSLRRGVALARGERDLALLEDAHLGLAEAQIADLDVAGALETAQELVRLAPATLDGRVHLASYAWALGRSEAATAALQDTVRLEPNHVHALLLLAYLHAALGRTEQAKAAFANAIDRSEAPFEPAERYVHWLAERGDLTEARAIADRLVGSDHDGDDVEARARLARAAKRPEQARAMIEKAIERGDATGRLTLFLGSLAAEAEDDQRALAAFFTIRKDSPSFLQARLRASGVLREAGKWDEAQRLLDEAVAGAAASVDDAVEIAIARSAIDEKRGDGARAARRLDEAAAKVRDGGGEDGSGARVTLALARAAVEERRGDWRRAVAIAEAVLAWDPRDARALNFAGFVAADHAADLPRARRRLQAAAALDPGSGEILDSVGWAHFRSGDLEEAAAFLEQAARLEPRDPEILGHLGDLYTRRSERTRAVDTYRRALAEKPDARLRRELEERVGTLEAKTAAGR